MRDRQLFNLYKLAVFRRKSTSIKLNDAGKFWTTFVVLHAPVDGHWYALGFLDRYSSFSEILFLKSSEYLAMKMIEFFSDDGYSHIMASVRVYRAQGWAGEVVWGKFLVGKFSIVPYTLWDKETVKRLGKSCRQRCPKEDDELNQE